ncbi:DNA repair ATPase [Streptomyces sp. NBC_00237]|uniref:DNA repair ATPase n=1 Tax=Streptomyces sp. NBC_00237 TaxID=2975687 RepID=UPI00225944E4|nr:DNA repair ATPase [Streptomyces sp. NBC_00237]MCX5205798.1 DNA repair ATPase [Streptomyces sp. NBC_00237]
MNTATVTGTGDTGSGPVGTEQVPQAGVGGEQGTSGNGAGGEQATSGNGASDRIKNTARENTGTTATEIPASAVDLGTYEVLRDRLTAQAADLTARTEALNGARIAAFGSRDLALTGTECVRTAAPSLPSDLVAIGDALLLGHRREPAPMTGPRVADVFSLYDRTGELLPESAVPGLLDDPAFLAAFDELHRYFHSARLLQLRRTDGKLLAVFRTGGRASDRRVLRWALSVDGSVRFLDAQGERDHVLPPAHDVTWIPATREDQVLGRHPHFSVVDGALYVTTVGGLLTVKTENDTESPDGIHSEPVDEPLQALADAEVAHARVGALILLRVRPYKEDTARHLVFHSLTGTVVRLDGLGRSCRRLPDDQGVVFPGGYALASGPSRTFDAVDPQGLEFEGEVRAPNGEDVLYIYRDQATGRTLLLPYNLIRKSAATPLTGDGFALFDDGALAVLRGSGEPGRVHQVQWWNSPYVSDVHAAAAPTGTGPLARIGNADLVRGISDCLTITRQATEATPTVAVYEALTAACTRITDRYHWLGDPAAGGLRATLEEVRKTAGQVLEEFRAVTAQTRQAGEALDTAASHLARLVRQVRGEAPATAEEWIVRITELRAARGRLIACKELRYADTGRIDAVAQEAEADIASAAGRAVAFLGREDAFAGYHAQTAQQASLIAEISTVAEVTPLDERLAGRATGLRTLTEVVTGLDIADVTVRTSILERVAEVLGGINRVRAELDVRRRTLLEGEGRAEFAAEFALLGQSVTAALAAAHTPEECDAALARLLLQLENLEARFAEHDDFLDAIEEQRTELQGTFAARRQTLHDARARRADHLAASAHRALEAIGRRAATLGSDEAVPTYFASDPMVAKVRRTVGHLRELGDEVRADELEGRLKAARQEAARTLRDRTELYADGGATIRLGRHRFAVATGEPELTVVPADDGTMAFALTGTDYRAPVTGPAFAATRPYWSQTLVSESPEVYRAEHLAARLLTEHGAQPLAEALAEAGEDAVPVLIRQAAEAAYDEGYERGVHDHDATVILRAVLRLHETAGLLRHPAAVRATAQLFWAHGTTGAARERWQRAAVSLVRARETFGTAPALDALRAELALAVASFLSATPGAEGPGRRTGEESGAPATPYSGLLFDGFGRPAEQSVPGSDGSGAPETPRTRILSPHGSTGLAVHGSGTPAPTSQARVVAVYLVEELALGSAFATSTAARTLLDKFRRAMGSCPYETDLRDCLVAGDLASARLLVEGWLVPYAAACGEGVDLGDLAEAVAVELCPHLPRREVDAEWKATVSGLLGTHPRITRGSLSLRLDEFLSRTADFAHRAVPGFRAYQKLRGELVAAERARLRLEEHRPRAMSSFVRNRLVDEVYLPLIGDNLAKQLGAADSGRRTDHSGLLLLLSPPGYGKTTLMEYVAERLGMLLVKVDGPALGHDVTSLDPAEAPNATARKEIEKISFALAAGNNVLLYLDDIQHTSPELLQKFIPLCDTTRSLNGHDLRGKRFAVCMAGNPYTESGQRFRIPDMLANRADVWNLGDVLTGKQDAFAASFVENALTSHPTLAPLAGGNRSDLDVLVRLAADDPTARADRLTRAISGPELDRIQAVLRHLLTARDTVLAVNAAYIASAARTDASRTRPPFQLQGSYRNMNKIVQRISPAMNAAELTAVIDDHYRSEAQTLTTGAESNLLELAALRGTLTPEQAARREEIATAYVREQALGGTGDDGVGRAVAALGLLADRMAAVESAIVRATDPRHLLNLPTGRHAARGEDASTD